MDHSLCSFLARYRPALWSKFSYPLSQPYPHLQPLPTVWGMEAGASPLTFLIGIVVKGLSVEDTPPLLPLRPEKAVV